nr:MgtC/SapB family protein [Eubacterium maltosivorans]
MIMMLLWEMELFARVVVAGICGAVIGYERQNRLKEAGIRTHLIVALGAALMMVVSKYGFSDIIGQNGVALDPSRIAAQIVTGVGFLGAGIIFVHKQSVSGLTTAAGIWATSGIGMAIGAGLYFIGVASALLIILLQIILHKNFRWLNVYVGEMIHVHLVPDEAALERFKEKITRECVEIINFKIKRNAEDCISMELYVKLPENYQTEQLLTLFKDDPDIISIEL